MRCLVGLEGLEACDHVPCRVLNAIAFKISEANEMSPENSYEHAHNRLWVKKKHLIERCLVGLQGLEPWTYRL